MGNVVRNFDLEIERAKKETIAQNRIAWQQEWLYKHRKDKGCQVAPEPPIAEITPKSWFITEWGTGFIVADLEKLMKCPKKVRDKIFALGGI